MSTRLLSGNEALARGAYEAGVALAAGYPGTPSTEILEALSKYHSAYCEWSPNEKVALEVAVGASLAGARALATMKHVGLNVAADPLFSCSYMGVNGGLVIVSADDPGMHSSQNEQDNRLLAAAARVPLLEPSTPEECRTFMRRAFALSEQFDTPVLLRSTTRLSHGRALVGSDDPVATPKRAYHKNRGKNVVLPAHAKVRHRLIEQTRMPALAQEAENWIEVVDGDDDVVIITSGMGWAYAREAFPHASILKLGMSYPLPEAAIRRFAGDREVVVVEELEPFLEQQIRAMGVRMRERTWPRFGELSVDLLKQCLAHEQPRAVAPAKPLPPRPPALCPGCSHRGAFHALGRMGAIVTGDIGCYTLGALPPLDAIDSCMNMGASIGMAHGFQKVSDTEKPVVAVIGDSTFFHSGITGLLDVVYNGGNTTTLILDNRTTAMTGHQGHPGTGERLSGDSAPAIDIEAIVRGVGIKDVRTLDPYNLDDTWRQISDAATMNHPTVLVSHAPCVLNERTLFGTPVTIDPDKCTDCHACTRLGCPAIELRNGKLEVNPLFCIGCTQCQQVCADCNAGIDVALMLALMEQDRVEEAIDVLLAATPLPATAARVCPHPCDHRVNAMAWQQADLRAKRYPELLATFPNDDSTDVSVRSVEQWLGDYLLNHPRPMRPWPEKTGTVGIVGSGPAGISAAWQLRRRGWQVTLIDADAQPGGMLRHGIPEFRLPKHILDQEIARLLDSGIQFRGSTRVGTDVTFEQLRNEYDALVVAVGDSQARAFPIEGEEAAPAHVLKGLELLRRFNAGERIDLGKKVAIIGGGNTAIDCARAAVRLGATAVVVYRRAQDRMPAIPEEVQEAVRDGVEFRFERVPTRLHSEAGRLVSIESAQSTTIGDKVVPLAGTESVEAFDNIVLAVGEEADLQFLAGTSVRAGRHIAAAAVGRTTAPGVFACGDVAFGYGTVTQAIASGRKTAEAVAQYLESVTQNRTREKH